MILAGIILLGLGCVSPSNANEGATPIGQTVSTNNLGGNDNFGNGGDTGTSGGTTSTVIEVDLKNLEFTPSTITVNAGQTIRFVNQDGFAHDVHIIKDGVDFFPRTQINAGATIDVEITDAGTYELICDRHLPGMAGSIEAN